MTEYIGYAAAVCTTVSFLPQAVKVFKTNHTKDISLGMFLLMTTGVLFWLIYGLIISAVPLIFANAFTFVFALYILVMKLKLDVVGRNKEAQPQG